MSDADEARKAKSLDNIDRNLRELVKIFAKFNENFVTFVKRYSEYEALSNGGETRSYDPAQMTLQDEDKENGHGGSTEQ